MYNFYIAIITNYEEDEFIMENNVTPNAENFDQQAPQAPQGFEPQAPQGYAPQAPQGFEPQAPQGYAPQAPQGFEPQQAPQMPLEKRCSKCQAVLADGQTFCPECGQSTKPVCTACGAVLEDGQAFCSVCGAKVPVQNNYAPGDYNPAVNQFNQEMAAPRKKPLNIPLIIAGAVIALIIIIAVASAGGSYDFNDEYSHLTSNSWCEISADGTWMKIDSNPYDSDDYFIRDALNEIEEMNEELGFSSSVYQKMLETRALDGRQSEETDKFKVSWSYHPDKGIEAIYEVKD